MKLIQFSSQNGSTQAGNAIRPFQIKLNRIFFGSDEVSELVGNYDYLSVVFRVNGKNKNFGPEGGEAPAKSKGKNILTMDFVVSESTWMTTSEDFGLFLGDSVKESFKELTNYLITTGEVSDTVKLYEAFESGMEKFKDFLHTA